MARFSGCHFCSIVHRCSKNFSICLFYVAKEVVCEIKTFVNKLFCFVAWNWYTPVKVRGIFLVLGRSVVLDVCPQ